jgi:hypothetical protein
MNLTLEARWFGDPPLPDTLMEWFQTLGAVETSTQTDLYLPAEDPTFNLKMRDDQLQIKRRVAGPFRKTLGPWATGACEQWSKWNFDLDEAPDALWDDDPTGLWVSLTKTRRQLTILPGAQSALTNDLPTTPSATINVELTTVEAEGDTAWTFCLETEGPVSSLADTFTTAAPLLLDESLPLTLPAEQSFGYVRWLQQRPGGPTRPTPEVQIPRL